MKKLRRELQSWLIASSLLVAGITIAYSDDSEPLVHFGEEKVIIECNFFNLLSEQGSVARLLGFDKPIKIRGVCDNIGSIAKVIIPAEITPSPGTFPINPIGPWCTCPDEKRKLISQFLENNQLVVNPAFRANDPQQKWLDVIRMDETTFNTHQWGDFQKPDFGATSSSPVVRLQRY